MNTMTAPRLQTKPTPARYTLLLLAALFLLPVALGTGLFWSGWRPTSFTNHGDLLQPALPLPETGLPQIDQRPLPTSALRGQWLLVLPLNQPCTTACEDVLHQLRQVHIALNKEQSRVQRVFLRLGAPTPAETPNLASIAQRFPQLILAVAPDSEAGRQWQTIFAGNGERIFVVDPMGNVMLRYANAANMRGVLKDMERLLKYSWVR